MNPMPTAGAPQGYGQASGQAAQAAAAAAAAAASMAMQRSHHATPPRFVELLEQLRAEVEKMVSENKSYLGVREEYQRKVQDQVRELSAMENALHDLTRKHDSMREQYEAEIARLKSQVAAAAPAPPVPSAPPPRSAPQPAVPPPGGPKPPSPPQNGQGMRRYGRPRPAGYV